VDTDPSQLPEALAQPECHVVTLGEPATHSDSFPFDDSDENPLELFRAAFKGLVDASQELSVPYRRQDLS
jgi:hypothetical protein